MVFHFLALSHSLFNSCSVPLRPLHTAFNFLVSSFKIPTTSSPFQCQRPLVELSQIVFIIQKSFLTCFPVPLFSTKVRASLSHFTNVIASNKAFAETSALLAFSSALSSPSPATAVFKVP